MIPNSSLSHDTQGSSAPTLEPILKVPLRLNVDGSMGAPTIDFGESDTLHIVEQVNDGWLPLVIWHAPTAAAVTLVAAPLLVCIVMARAARRRQRFGHFYCRKCNYDVTGPGGMPPEVAKGGPEVRCPECGTDLGVKSAKLGRSFAGRVWKAALCALILMILSAGMLLAMLERANPTNSWKTVWMEPLSSTGLLPRLVRAEEFFSDDAALRVSTWQLPQGRQLAKFRVASAYPSGAVTKDGEWLAWREFNGPSGGNEVRTANLRTGDRSTLTLPTSGPYNINLITPSIRPGHVIVGYTNSVPRAMNDAVLVRFELATGRAEVVGQVSSLPANKLAGGGTFVFREQGGRLQWAYIAYGQGATRGLLSGTMFTAGKQVFPFELAATYWMPPQMSADGLSVELLAGAGTATPSITRVLIADGSQTTVPNVGFGSQLSVAEDGTLVEWLRTGGGQLQMRTPGGQVAGVLGTQGGMPNVPVISRDGHWAAAAVTTSTTTITGSPAFDAYVLVWDLEMLKAAK